MCGCINVKIGSYDNQVELISPGWSNKNIICVDKCLEKEIKYLWDLGIITTGCCCGHNKGYAYIGVEPEFIDEMKLMGYRIVENSCRPKDNDSFLPKIIKKKEVFCNECGHTVDINGLHAEIPELNKIYHIECFYVNHEPLEEELKGKGNDRPN